MNDCSYLRRTNLINKHRNFSRCSTSRVWFFIVTMDTRNSFRIQSQEDERFSSRRMQTLCIFKVEKTNFIRHHQPELVYGMSRKPIDEEYLKRRRQWYSLRCPGVGGVDDGPEADPEAPFDGGRMSAICSWDLLGAMARWRNQIVEEITRRNSFGSSRKKLKR